MRTLILLLSLAALPVGAASQQPSAPAAVPSVVAGGDGEVLVAPDRAFLDVAVETTAPTAVAAAAENARLMATVSEAVRRAGVPAAAVSGAGYSVSANMVYEQGAARQQGYRAVNTLRIELDRFDRVGAVVDAALAAGANRISDVRYTTRDAASARQRAIAAAVQRARVDAESMARAAGGSLGPLLEVSNVRSEVPGMFSGAAARSVRDETSIAPRELFVRAVVVTRWAFVQP
jgi:uncharacterized protein YggE